MIVVTHVENGVNIDAILEQMGIDENRTFLAYAADQAYRYMDKYVPKSNGHYDSKTGMFIQPGMLRKEHLIYPEGDGVVIEYTQPYSRYQYYGVRADGSHRVQNYTTPGTGPYWDLAMLTAEGEDYMGELTEFVDKRLNK